MNRRLLTFLVVSASLAAAAPAKAQLGLDFTGYNGVGQGGGYTMGYFFDVVNPITIDELGYFDDGKDGLAESHQLGLWDAGGTLLATTTVGAGTSGTLEGFYRMVGIAPLVLAPGSGYVVGGYVGGSDPWIGTNFSNVTGTTTDPNINVTAAAWANGGFFKPDNSHNVNPPAFYGGANFSEGGVVATPEPASIVLLATGLIGVVGYTRRSRKTH